MTASLSHADVAKLVSNPSAESRAETVAKVATHISTESLSQEERKLAEDIVRAMVRDASALVREALSANLKTAKNLPRDLVLALANDIDSVAAPILEFSDLLSVPDLVDLVRNGHEARQIAIARRKEVPAELADALIETDNAHVVGTLVGNNGATLSEAGLNRIVDRFGDMPAIQEPLVKRDRLPIAVAERLVARLSDHLRDYLVAHHDLTIDSASELILKARERATVNLIGEGKGTADVERLARQLYANGRLTPSLVLRALCAGDVLFFEVAISTMAKVKLPNARRLIHDPGMLGLQSLCTRAGLPPSLQGAIRMALDVAQETDFGGADYDREIYSRTMIERILTQCDTMRSEDADYLLRRLDDLASAHA